MYFIGVASGVLMRRKAIFILIPVEIVLYLVLGWFLSLVSLCGIAAIITEYDTIRDTKEYGESIFSPSVLTVTFGVIVTVVISITILVSELVIFK